MQPWQGQGGNGDDNSSWQSNFNAFAPQDGQYSQQQNWAPQHQTPGGAAYAQPQVNHVDSPANLYHDSNQFSNYSGGHETLGLGRQYNGQGLLGGASFNDVQRDPYGQQDNGRQAGQQQVQPQQGFSHQAFADFNPQTHLGQQQQPQQQQQQPQYSQPQQRQYSQAPAPNYSHNIASTQLRPSPTPPIPREQSYTPDIYAPQLSNGQQTASYQTSHQQPQYQQQSSSYPQALPNNQFNLRQSAAPQFSATQPQPLVYGQNGTPQPPQNAPYQPPPAAGYVEEPSPKRQRTMDSATFSPAPEAPPTATEIRSRFEELDSLPPPTQSPEEAQLVNTFSRRTKAAQTKFPPIAGLPNLVSLGSVKLPAPKSYDKLAPLVATPSRSKKPLVPEMGYDLPAEIQGRFASQYAPAPDKLGLDERRVEAQALLDEFETSMKATGKRRPKYTEYPHTFKEQLKADELSKNKKAKKELKEDKSKPIRPPTRPDDIVEGAAWDAIGIVRVEPSASKTSSPVANRIQQAGDLFIKLRGDMNQAKQQLDQAVLDKKPEAEIATLRKAAEERKMALHRAIDATIEHADDAIIDNLGTHQKLILSLVNVLISSIKANDFTGKLPKVVFELFTHIPMTKKIAETTNFDTVRKRFSDKGDDEMKELVREVSIKVRKVLKEAESTGYSGTSAAGRARAAATKPTTDAASTKRGRTDDTADGRTVKRVATESTGGSSLMKKLAQPKIQLQSASKSTAAKGASTISDRARTAPSKPSVKPEASEDKPKVEAKKKAVKPPAPTMGPEPSSGALSGIGSLLASINTPQAKAAAAGPSQEKAKKGTPPLETEEERTKRLRKEARRNLRVSWKPASELVQIKVFEKEESEDEGRHVNMVRDAADDKSEGMVLKQRANVEDDDSDSDDEVPFKPWMAPLGLDYSPLPESTREKNYVTRGGRVTFRTEEQEAIAKREGEVLIAAYATDADIPPSPSSPKMEAVTGDDIHKVANLPVEGPKYEEVQNRWWDEQHLGADGALYAALQRLGTTSSPANMLDSILGRLGGSTTTQPAASVAAPKLGGTDTNVPLAMGSATAEQVVALLRSDRAQAWRDPNPVTSDIHRVHHYSDPQTKNSAAVLEAAVRLLAGKPYPATAPPDWLQHDEERIREWWFVYNKDAAARQRRADEQRARAEAERAAQMGSQPVGLQASGADAQAWMAWYARASPQEQQAYAPYMAMLAQQMGGGQPSQPPAPTQPPQGQPDQMQAILAAMGQGQPKANASGAYGYNPDFQAGQQQSLSTNDRHDYGRGLDARDSDRHNRDHNDWDDYSRDEYGRENNRNKDKKKNKPGPSTIHKPPNVALIGTKPCTFWQQGKCARGDKCTFRHD
ncbi:uncharacterized protein F5Z01DRAFT_673048 [Emericellopsis atlantica]|uniref:C3H1-type domain-containing protein n=1 Tax=Emericellopsis atlantica TaxID=2614577 RepID=A0A9P7ZQE2_9HYPO|nr:uncharacterized protein F5Z01DRAFT_673048 [Emericellopsis atlantica]KAG9255753.1 hypothetical protein F5Z01DRAFT_673048 [Emericellopsis atlantica]